MEADDILRDLEKGLKPSFECKETAGAEGYTLYLNELHRSAAMANAFERHAGFGRDYPGSPMIDGDFELREDEVVAMQRFVDAKPFRVDEQGYVDLVQRLYIDLAECHDHLAPVVRHDGDWDLSEQSEPKTSYYTPHMVSLTGPRSVITALHEYTHSLGYGEVVATWYSTNVFRLFYPKSFAKLKMSRANPHMMRRFPDPELVVGPEHGKRKGIASFPDFVEAQTSFWASYKENREAELLEHVAAKKTAESE